MLYKYFKFTKKRIAVYTSLLIAIFILQYVLTGSLVSKQTIETEAGNSNSSVIGIIDDEEIIRQKFSFERKVVLSKFTLSFGSFQRENVGDNVDIQMTDGDNNVVYHTSIPVDKIEANQTYTVDMDHTVTIPKGVVCCIKITCSSSDSLYNKIPTLNTTNRTDPNTFMSTLKMQTHKKSLNISYTYSYRQLFPLIIMIIELAVLFVLCFEHITDYAVVYRKKRQKEIRRNQKEQKLHEDAANSRAAAATKKTKKNASLATVNTKNKHVKHNKANIKNIKNKKKHTSKNKGLKNFVKWCLAEPKVIKTIRRIVIIFNPLVLAVILESMNGTAATIYPNVWIFTWILLAAVELILFAIIGNISISMLVMDIILLPIGLANLFIMNVRGTPFLPADILGVATATEVADHYTLSLTPAQFIVLPAFIIWCVLIMRLKEKKKQYDLRKKIVRRAVPIVSACAIVFTLYNTGLLELCGIKDNVWNKVASCKSNGFYMNYFINLHYLKVSEPSGYSQDKIAEILDNVDKDTTEPTADSSKKTIMGTDFKSVSSLNGKKPNIILIMNESLADFSKLGKVNYNQDPLSYIHSLKDNTISGLDYVSVFGAGTSNSEFEAMTGNTMKFFPSGSNVYQQFMHDSTYSISSYLKSLGYSCDAVHPSSGTNWNRVNTYKSMKFDRFITIDEFKNPEYIRYISDKESYKKVISLYEDKKKKKQNNPMFVFDMTIQNHGGYLTNTNWDDPVTVNGAHYTEANEYLSSTKVSDDAFKYLIDYFKKADEPTIICMFGDHQPSIETEFYEDLLGKSQSDWELDDIQKRFATPFIIWANYDIQEGEDVVIGNNYIENLLLKQAGIELPLYNKYIEKVTQTIPAMNVNGYMDKDGKWHKYDKTETEDVSKLLNDYETLQYGYYSDMDKDSTSKLFKMEK